MGFSQISLFQQRQFGVHPNEMYCAGLVVVDAVCLADATGEADKNSILSGVVVMRWHF